LYKRLFLIAAASLLFMSTLASKELEKVSLQLRWLDQFQFAGYYIAKEKGFYKDIGLHVDIKKFKFGINTTDEVITKKATYATGITSLVIDKSKGKDVVLLAAILQSSPLALVSKKSSNIKKLEDLINKKVMISEGNILSAELDGILNSRNVDIKKFMLQKDFDKVQLFIENKVDAISVYTTNQLYYLDKSNIKYNLFHPKDYGFDFYSDILYTSKTEITQHKQRAINFTKASLEGWEYAFSHIEETVDLILDKYNTQNKTREALIYEAKELKKLAYFNTTKLGEIKKEKIQKIYDTYNTTGLVKKSIDMDEFILYVDNKNKINFSEKEKKWLKNNPIIIYSEINWKPLSIIEDGKMKGIMGDYLDIVSRRTGIEFKFVPSDSWQEVLDKFENKEIDIVPGIGSTFNETSLGYVSNTYKRYPMAIVTTNKYKFIEDLSELNGKIVVVPKGYTSHNFVREQFPKIKLKTTSSIEEALLLVDKGQADAFIGHIATSLNYISELYLKSLKISGTSYFEFKHKFLIQKDDPELLLIINKALKSITAEEKAKINAKWLSTTVDKKLDYTMIWLASFVVLIIFFLFIYINRKLKSHNIKLEESHKIIKEKDIKLELINDSLEEKINDATISLLSKNRELSASLESFKNLLDTTIEVIIIIDMNFNIIDVNKSGVDILGYENKLNLIGMNILSLIDTDDRDKAIESLKLEYVKPYKVKILKKSKEILNVLTSGRNFMRNDEKIRIITWTDLTEVIRKEEELLKQQKLAQMGEALSMIADQWRQPLIDISLTNSKIKSNIESDVLDKDMLIDKTNQIENILDKITCELKSHSSFNLLDQYRDTMDKVAIITKTDAHGIITFVNDRFCDISGYSREEVIGKSHSIVRHRDMDSIVYKNMWHTIKDLKKTWTGEIKNRKKDGTSYIVFMVVKPILDEDDNLIEYISMKVDNTEHVKLKQYFEDKLEVTSHDLEEAMNLSNKYELVINESNILSRSDLKGKITYANSKFCEISGYAKEELIGKNHNIVRHEDVPSEVFKELWTTIRFGKIWQGILKNKSKSGKAYWVKTTIVPIKDDNNKIVEYMAIRHDITEVFDLHKEIEETQREVIYRMGEVGETRSKETGHHVKRVAQYSKDLAILCGLSYEESEILFTASPMHDIGKVGIPDEILKKPGKLTADEFKIMKTHAKIGYNVLKGSKRPVLNAAATVALEHHEKWDGSGYPKGLSGEDIHIYGRITALADVFDALGSKRVYKDAWEDDRIFALFQEERGKHFDPNLIDLFMDNLDIFLETRNKYKDK